MENITKRIAWLIAEKCGGNRSKFARDIGITPAYAAQIYNGDRIPSDRTIADICRVFGVNKVWLETGSGEPFQEMSRAEKLAEVFGGILAGHKSEKNAFIEAVAQLPDDLFPVFVQAWIESAEQMKKSLEK